MKKTLAFAMLAAAATAFAAQEELFVKPGSAKGYVALVNAQKAVAEPDFKSVLETIRAVERWDIRIVADEAAAKDAALIVKFLEGDGKAPLTAQPEAGRATVDVNALLGDLKTDAVKKRFAVSRFRKMLLRAFCYAAGAAGSGFSGNILDIAKARDLDYIKEFIPMDTQEVLRRVMKSRGLKPEYAVTYIEACDEGWAPAPKTPEQKQIWDEMKDPKKRFERDFPDKK